MNEEQDCEPKSALSVLPSSLQHYTAFVPEHESHSSFTKSLVTPTWWLLFLCGRCSSRPKKSIPFQYGQGDWGLMKLGVFKAPVQARRGPWRAAETSIGWRRCVKIAQSALSSFKTCCLCSPSLLFEPCVLLPLSLPREESLKAQIYGLSTVPPWRGEALNSSRFFGAASPLWQRWSKLRLLESSKF